LSQSEVAEIPGVSERTFRRWRDRLRDERPEGLADRRIGKPSSRRAAAEEILRMLGLWREHYADFTVKHFH
jgi:transposase